MSLYSFSFTNHQFLLQGGGHSGRDSKVLIPTTAASQTLHFKSYLINFVKYFEKFSVDCRIYGCLDLSVHCVKYDRTINKAVILFSLICS